MSSISRAIIAIAGIAPFCIRFVYHVPGGVLMTSGTYYEDIRDIKGVYDMAPGAKSMMEGQLLVGTVGLILTFWNFFMWLPSQFVGSVPILALLVGSVDLGLTLAIIVGIAMQATLLPFTYQGCDEMTKNKFFVAASDSIPSAKTPQSVCREMVWIRAYGICMMSLYSIITACNLFIGILGLAGSIEARAPGFFSNRSTWLSKKVLDGFDWSKTSVLKCCDYTVQASAQLGKRMSTYSVPILSLPAQTITLVRRWRAQRAATLEESLVEMAIRDEEELGLIPKTAEPREEEGEEEDEQTGDNKSVDKERVGLMSTGRYGSAQGEDDNLDDTRRWSGETVTTKPSY